MVLDQFGNADNPLGHYRGTGPELWEQTNGRITHFVSSMGTTGALTLHACEVAWADGPVLRTQVVANKQKQGYMLIRPSRLPI